MTETTETIDIHSDYDILWVRLRTRDFARQNGLDLMGQARISLATSAVASGLGLGPCSAGQVTLTRVTENDAAGIMTVCRKFKGGDCEPVASDFGNAHWIVDDLLIETLPTDEIQVTLVQWNDGRRPSSYK